MADIYASNWTEDDASNNTASPDGMPEGMSPSGVNNWGRAAAGAIKRYVNQQSPKTTGGTSTAYTLAYTVTPGALVDGMTHLVQFNAVNGAAATLNINSLGAIPLYTYQNGAWAAAPAGVITADTLTHVSYHTSSGTYRVHKVQSSGTWTPTDASGAGLTFTGVSAKYQIIGNMVFAYFRLTYPTTANGLGAAIGGLPLTAPNQTYASIPSPINGGGATGFIGVNANATTASILSSAGATVINSAVSGLTFNCCITYPAS